VSAANVEPWVPPERRPEVESEGLILTDDSHAEWAMKKRRQEVAEINRLEALKVAEIQHANEWADEHQGPRRAAVERLDAALIDYYRRLEDADPDLPKTYNLPSSVVRRRKQPIRAEVVDTEAVTNWALSNAPEILSTPHVQVSRIKPSEGYQFTEEGDVVSPDGEVVPGVHVVGGDDRYSVGEK